MMKDIAKNAIIGAKELEDKKEYADILAIAENQVKAFMGGHISNMDAVAFNEGRRILENMHDNVMQEVSVRLAKEQVKKMKFNRNTYKLSVVTHPRALFRGIVATDAQKQGINHFKMVIPPIKRKELNPAGITAGLLFTIMTVQQWNDKTGVKNNVDTVGGMGTHHNDFSYFYPVEEENLNEEMEIAKKQRVELNKELK